MKKSKELQYEEEMREMSLNHGPAYCDATLARVSKKTLVFMLDKDRMHEDYRGHDTKIQFQKSNNNGESLEICVSWNEFKHAKCDMGHTHQIDKKERQYKPFHLDWSHIDQLIEWIQLGTWSEMNGKGNNHSRCFNKVLDVLTLIESHCDVSLLKPQIKKVREEVNMLLKNLQRRPENDHIIKSDDTSRSRQKDRGVAQQLSSCSEPRNP